MLEFYKNQELDLQPIDEIVPNCWINAVNPTQNEIEKIAALGIPQDFVTYPLDMDERPRIEEEDDGTILIVVRIPTSHPQDDPDIPYGTMPMGIILADKYIVTVCSQPTSILDAFSAGKVSKLSTTKRYRFTLRLLMAVTNRFLDALRDINKLTDKLEDMLSSTMKNDVLIKLFKCQKSYVYFSQGLKQNELVLVKMSRLAGFKKFEEDEDLLQDVITENTQAIDMTSISSDILSGMMDAFASVISNNLNVVMKLLASVTIILELPNIITGFMGMNVRFTDEVVSSPAVPFIVLGVMLVVTFVAIYIFNKKDWF
ncbi:MAG: magnesium transporter CorA family protein [Flexilinea sp.]|nr:magnesium transporter CorA family protein [Flexilinea sp.]